MTTGNNRFLHVLAIAIILLGTIASAVGLFYTTGGKPYDVVNQYGDTVKIYGQGLYAHDSFFKAPIFRGTDFTMLFLAIPLLILALIRDIRKKTLKTRLFLTSIIAVFTYYAASNAFGVAYNFLHLVYIGLFSAGVFGLIAAMMGFNYTEVENRVKNPLPYKGIYTFLIFTGIALFVAWLPDIISAMLVNRPLALIEVYTTEITYVLDMGIIAPLSFICLYLLMKRKGLGYVLLDILLTVCAIIGVMLPIQSVFQVRAGIVLPLPVLITKVASFCLLALFAGYFKWRVLRNIVEN